MYKYHQIIVSRKNTTLVSFWYVELHQSKIADEMTAKKPPNKKYPIYAEMSSKSTVNLLEKAENSSNVFFILTL